MSKARTASCSDRNYQLQLALPHNLNVETSLAVVEKDLAALPYPNLRAVHAVATGIDVQQKRLILADGSGVSFDKLCICTGATPKVETRLVAIMQHAATQTHLIERRW